MTLANQVFSADCKLVVSKRGLCAYACNQPLTQSVRCSPPVGKTFLPDSACPRPLCKLADRLLSLYSPMTSDRLFGEYPLRRPTWVLPFRLLVGIRACFPSWKTRANVSLIGYDISPLSMLARSPWVNPKSSAAPLRFFFCTGSCNNTMRRWACRS